MSRSTFQAFGLNESLVRGIRAAGFDLPRPIQAEAIPAAMAGRDVLGLAQTGTGKTAAFALPLMHRLLDGRGTGPSAPRALVLAPTRELANQIAVETRTLGKHTPLKVVTVFGGVSARGQIEKLRRTPDIVVGCPGRVLDLLQQGELRLGAVETLVLDEADHMFDMGFLRDIRRIIRALPKRRQNLLFSATMPADIRRLADELLDRPHVVEQTRSAPADTVDHGLFYVQEREKHALLERLLRGDDCDSAIVFTRTKRRAKRLARQLSDAGHRAVGLQGNMSQNQRDRAMAGFRSRRYDILVATDVASRGIDVSEVSHVINFDVPNTPEAYTHRIGRTGRSGREGVASTFVTSDDAGWVRSTERMIGAAIPRRQLAGVGTASAPVSGGQRGARSDASPSASKRRSTSGAGGTPNGVGTSSRGSGGRTPTRLGRGGSRPGRSRRR